MSPFTCALGGWPKWSPHSEGGRSGPPPRPVKIQDVPGPRGPDSGHRGPDLGDSGPGPGSKTQNRIANEPLSIGPIATVATDVIWFQLHSPNIWFSLGRKGPPGSYVSGAPRGRILRLVLYDRPSRGPGQVVARLRPYGTPKSTLEMQGHTGKGTHVTC